METRKINKMENEEYFNNKNNYTIDDLKNAFIAGQELVLHVWNMDEFHEINCQCEKFEYKNFEDWFKLNYI